MRARRRTDEVRESDIVIQRNHLCGFFSDHNGRRVGIAAVWHDAGISYAQIPYALYLEVWINKAANAASAGQVICGDREVK